MGFLNRLLMYPFLLALYAPVFIALALLIAVTLPSMKQPLPVTPTPTPPIITQSIISRHKMLKDVGEPFIDHLGLTPDDFKQIKDAGFTLIEGNFDICASDEDVKYFLDQSQSHGLLAVMPAGSGEAEWGYQCDVDPVKGQYPVWQKQQVQSWVKKWMSHPALYAWDTSNEAGGNFPFGQDLSYHVTAEQLNQAYTDVKAIDQKHPVMIRMNGWYFYDNEENFFDNGNPFAKNVADIVMLNAYSNVDEYFPDFVSTVVSRARASILKIEPSAAFIVALGVWEEPPLWFLPTQEHLQLDYNQAIAFEKVTGIAYFKYGASSSESEWFIQDDDRGAPALWQFISRLP
ncbi:hypothetical protein HGA91_05175 [candidate division WWE3 bacterium]|nr:hypothetical protein [candidate division WWE3 bacterium]